MKNGIASSYLSRLFHFCSSGSVVVTTALLFAVVLRSCPARAQVYEWTDPRGTRHFSSQKRGDQFKKADLPNIMREKFGSRAALLKGCSDHGGINCQAGADSDGSVICYDGFREAAARYRFSCSMPKLTATEVRADDDGEGYKVIIRNESSVEALKPLLSLPESFGTPSISGPETIPPLEVAEFKITGAPSAPSTSQVKVQCANCG